MKVIAWYMALLVWCVWAGGASVLAVMLLLLGLTLGFVSVQCGDVVMALAAATVTMAAYAFW